MLNRDAHVFPNLSLILRLTVLIRVGSNSHFEMECFLNHLYLFYFISHTVGKESLCVGPWVKNLEGTQWSGPNKFGIASFDNLLFNCNCKEGTLLPSKSVKLWAKIKIQSFFFSFFLFLIPTWKCVQCLQTSDDIMSPKEQTRRHWSNAVRPKGPHSPCFLLQDVVHLYLTPGASAVTYWRQLTSFQRWKG